MLSMKCFQAAAVTLAALGFGFAGPNASAGSCGSQRSYHSGHYGHSGSHVRATFGGDHYRVSVSVGSSRHYGHGHTSHRRVYHRDRGYHHQDRGYHHAPPRCETRTVRHVVHQPSGYYKRVYHPPVYRTCYRECGTPYRECVRAGYYEKVWVSTGYHHY